ncbi:hypothetical protein [Burkholderia gladioli]|uniref:hypothetical protein n=1 Tax=Burkholderia gladioli TaxID=28095 RepID=UPI00163E0C73|nr:hypothetical protein [Burkholderia gladioli]MBJ9675262.1 hypothetical protein [Burkholderia gladioli]MDN7463514.1 hypothetical protein [Burkholderia gladioli]
MIDHRASKTNRHVGSDFDAFLAEDAMLETATAIAMQRAVACESSRPAASAYLR